MKKAQKTLKRFGAAGCAAALALSLFGCGQTGAPSQSLPPPRRVRKGLRFKASLPARRWARMRYSGLRQT